MNFWQNFTRREDRYDFMRLIDSRELHPIPRDKDLIHIICDIDKTYLETEFSSLIDMAKTALESAGDKQTVQGANDVLLAARWGTNKLVDGDLQPGFPRPLHFVSSSPPQLRKVLEEKLIIDGLDWTTDTFKNQIYNVLRGRMDLLRQHIAYKSAAILRVVRIAGDQAKFIMIGDNAESDAFIYVGVKLYLTKKLSPKGYARYLHISGIDKDIAEEIAQRYEDVPNSSIPAILIRNAPGYDFTDVKNLTGSVRIFNHYFEVALILIRLKVLPPECLPNLIRSFHNRFNYSLSQLLAGTQQLLEAEPSIANICESVKRKLIELGASEDTHELLNLHLPDDSKLEQLNEEEILANAKDWVSLLESKRKH